jgi:hypothetical protein
MSVSKPEALIIIVIGRSSSVQKTTFYNSDIITRISKEVFGMTLHKKQERAFQNRFGQTIYEDLLFLGQNTGFSSDIPAITEKSKEIGKSILSEALDRAPSDRIDHLNSAICSIDRITASPFLNFH